MNWQIPQIQSDSSKFFHVGSERCLIEEEKIAEAKEIVKEIEEMKYTRKDVIIWPDDKRLKGAIRKKAYFGENPNDVLNDANENRYAMKLYKIEKSSDHPFMSAETAGWHFLILKKGAEKKIVPFDFSLKEDRDAVKDKWLIDKATGTETKVLNFIKSSNGFWTVELFINREWISIVPAGLLEYYVFADTGKPVGKEVEV